MAGSMPKDLAGSVTVNPRGTFQEIADALKGQIRTNRKMAELPPITDLMRDHRVSRGVVLRAFAALQRDGIAEPVPGRRWRVIRAGQSVDSRPLADRIADVITDDGLKVGETFPSTSALSERFDSSRPTVTKALEKLEAAGLLSKGRQGKLRTVQALPNRKGHSQ
jgi:DNA-binding GntR family transcriptional regulator